MISFLWHAYGRAGEIHEPAGIAQSGELAGQCARMAMEADMSLQGAKTWEIKLTTHPNGRLEWQPVRVGLIFTRDDEQRVVTLPRVSR